MQSISEFLREISAFSAVEKADKVCVVSVISNDFLNPSCTAHIINELLDLDICCVESDDQSKQNSRCAVQFYHDLGSGVVIANLNLQSLWSRGEGSSFFEDYEVTSQNFLRESYLLFSLSHIVVLVQSNAVFDLAWLGFLKSLTSMRDTLKTKFNEELRLLEVSPIIATEARFCAPRLLFCFQNPPIREDIDSRVDKVERFEQSLELQIYQILKRSKITSAVVSEAICALASNDPFVNVITIDDKVEEHDPMEWLTSLVDSGLDFSTSRADEVTMGSKSSKRLHKLLMGHVDQAFGSGFNDNAARNVPRAPFELPTLAQFEIIVPIFRRVIDAQQTVVDDDGQHQHMHTASLRFSKARCEKVLPQAFNAYRESLPDYYPEAQHKANLHQALAMLRTSACGPALEQSVHNLMERCETYWRSGHQSCLSVSLTGNSCLNPVHSDIHHNSKAKLLSACSCGCTQLMREDPFDTRSANYDFYWDVNNFLCCSGCEQIRFPVFKPSSVDVRVADVSTRLFDLQIAALSQEGGDVENNSTNSADDVRGGSMLAQRDGVKRSTLKDVSVEDFPSLSRAQNEDDTAVGCELSADAAHESQLSPPGNIEQDKRTSSYAVESISASTTEYLPTMLNSMSPPGLLPLYSSWSLLCLGSSSLYSHSHGLRDMPGFRKGTNYLLPWEAQVTIDRERWQAELELVNARKAVSARPRPMKLFGESSESERTVMTVKVFVGFEFECLRGHRFMLESPTEIMRGQATSRNAASVMLENDVPLLFVCQTCASSTAISTVARLLRIHIVTPKAPVHVCILPRAQPPPCLDPTSGHVQRIVPPTFHTGITDPLPLGPGEYYVLRLPFVYESDQGKYFVPKTIRQSTSGKWLKGSITVEAVDTVR